MRSVRRRAFSEPTCSHRDKYRTQSENTKVFGFAFYKKRTGVGRAHGIKAKQKQKTKEQSEAIKKKKGMEA